MRYFPADHGTFKLKLYSPLFLKRLSNIPFNFFVLSRLFVSLSCFREVKSKLIRRVLFLCFLPFFVFLNPDLVKAEINDIFSPSKKLKILNGFVVDQTQCEEVSRKLGKPLIRSNEEKRVTFEYYKNTASPFRIWAVFKTNGRKIKKLESEAVSHQLEKITIIFNSRCFFQDYLYFTTLFDLPPPD